MSDPHTAEVDELRRRLHEAEEAIRAIRSGEIDALVLGREGSEKVFVLEGSEQMYRHLVEGMQEGAGTINDDGLILYCNDRFVSMLGLAAENVTGHSLYSFVAESARDDLTTAIAACTTMRVTITTLLHGNNLRRSARLTLRDLQTDTEGRTISFVATDLTQEARAEQQLSIATLAHQALLLGGSLDSLFDTACRQICATAGIDFAFVFEFEPARNTFRVVAGPEEIPPHAPFDVARAPCESMALRSKSTLVAVSLAEPFLPAPPMETRNPASLMCVALRSDRRLFGVLSAYSLRTRDFSDEEVRYLEDTARILAAAIDRKQYEEETVRSRQELVMLLDEAPDAIIRLDREHRIEYINPVALRITGMEERRVIGHPLDELPLGSDLLQPTVDAVDRVFHTAQGVQVEITAGQRVLDTRFVPSFNAAGEIAYVLAMARDVTEQRKAEQEREAFRRQAEHAQRVSSLGRLSATIAHEFNNVLMSIQPFAELLERQFAEDSPEHKYAATIIDAVSRGKKTTEDVLRYSRAVEPVRAPLELGPWLHRFRATLEPLIGPAVTLHLDLPERPLYADADRLQIEQVLTNLAINARDAMQGKGSIRISVSDPGAGAKFRFAPVPNPERFVDIAVIDSGPGIPDEVLPHIFEPLFTTKKGGTGLGLAVAHQIAASHDGILFVETSPADGTSFHLFLPRSPAPELAPARESPPERPFPEAIRTVAIVEDDASVLEGISLLLEMEGIVVVSSDRGAGAEPLIEANAPDLLILDVGLPDMDGVDVYFKIAKRWPNLPVLFSTGHGDVSRVLAIGSPHVGCLTKPYDLEMLTRAIRSLEIA